MGDRLYYVKGRAGQDYWHPVTEQGVYVVEDEGEGRERSVGAGEMGSGGGVEIEFE